MRAKLICEFERGISPRKALGLGKEHIRKIIEDYKAKDKFGEMMGDYGITDDLKVKLKSKYTYGVTPESIINDIGNKHKEIKFEIRDFLGGGLNEIEWDIVERSIDLDELNDNDKMTYYIHNLYHLLVNLELSPSDHQIKDLMGEMSEVFDDENIQKRIKEFKPAYTNIFKDKMDILLSFLSEYKSEEEKEIEEDFAEYIFVAKPDYKEVKIGDKTYHDKTISIENLYQINKYDKGTTMAIQMMKMRAQAQSGDGSKFYRIWIPKYLHDKQSVYDYEIGDELRDYIETTIKRK